MTRKTIYFHLDKNMNLVIKEVIERNFRISIVMKS